MVFDSNFECGNLNRACIVSLSEYNLFLNSDTNTKGNSQWFYFSVTNTEKGRTVTFNILNCTKAIMLFKLGMKPYAYSEIEHEDKKIDWTTDTFNVIYSRLQLNKNNNCNQQEGTITTGEEQQKNYSSSYFTLSFNYTFKHSGDRVYFAYSRPYTTTMLSGLLNQIKGNLLEDAKSAKELEEDGLQSRIREFVQEDFKNSEQNAEKDKKLQPEDQFKIKTKKHNLSKNDPLQTLVPENALVGSEVLKEYANKKQSNRFEWLKIQDYQIETDTFIYRKETLSHTLSGFPVDLITITAYQ